MTPQGPSPKSKGTTPIPTRFSREELARIERTRPLIGASTRSAFIRQAVLEKLEELEGTGIIQIRDVSREEALRLIDDYLRTHPGIHYVSELVEELGLEPRTVFAAAQKLIDEGRARIGED
ncbi:MAG: hypothetical protein ACE5GJ_14925 [Gemmatimonadota bacterium]